MSKLVVIDGTSRPLGALDRQLKRRLNASSAVVYDRDEGMIAVADRDRQKLGSDFRSVMIAGLKGKMTAARTEEGLLIYECPKGWIEELESSYVMVDVPDTEIEIRVTKIEMYESSLVEMTLSGGMASLREKRPAGQTWEVLVVQFQDRRFIDYETWKQGKRHASEAAWRRLMERRFFIVTDDSGRELRSSLKPQDIVLWAHREINKQRARERRAEELRG